MFLLVTGDAPDPTLTLVCVFLGVSLAFREMSGRSQHSSAAVSIRNSHKDPALKILIDSDLQWPSPQRFGILFCKFSNKNQPCIH